MRRLFLLSLLCIPFQSHTQDPLDKYDPDDSDTRYLDLSVRKHADKSVHFPFYRIQVIDSRYDTTKLGYDSRMDWWNGKTKVFKKVLVRMGLQRGLEEYYNEYYGSSFTNTGLSLLIVIKKFWLINTTGLKAGSNGGAFKQLYNFPTVKFEYYLFDDSMHYYPVKRIDTTYRDGVYKRENARSEDMKILNFALSDLVESIDFTTYAANLAARKSRTLQEIENYNNSMFNKPILKDTFYRAGVYLNYSEFINNKPGARLDELQGIQEYWGYCDGKDIFINHHNIKIYRSGNAFEYLADKVQAMGSSMFSLDGNPRFKALNLPVQIDMETGQPYTVQ